MSPRRGRCGGGVSTIIAEAKAAAITSRIEALDAQARLSPEDHAEMIRLKERMDEAMMGIGINGLLVGCPSRSEIEAVEAELHEYEQRLRQFDAQ